MSPNTNEPFIFYYFPTSFSSQKVLFALYEKEVAFKRKYVSLFSGQHNESWYVKLNPDGTHISVLKHGNKVIVEPAQIIDYISQITQVAGGHPLVPSLASELGRNVQELREQLDNIPVDILTYGVIYHPQLSATGCQIPGATQRSMKENFAKRLCLLIDLATKHPDLRDAYLMKSQTAASSFDIITDEGKVHAQLEGLVPLFISIEKQLQKIKEVGSDISDELWLFGPMFTAADISLAILLSRLSLLGLADHLFPVDHCPCIHQYFEQIKKRPAFIKIEKDIATLKYTLVWENLKDASPYILGVVGMSLLAVTGYFAYKKFISAQD